MLFDSRVAVVTHDTWPVISAVVSMPRDFPRSQTVTYTVLEVATPTAPPLSGRGYHALTWRSHGHSVAAYCDVVSARQCSYPVSALSGVHLPPAKSMAAVA